MQVCFEDEDVGGMDPKTNSNLLGQLLISRKILYAKIVSNCEKIVYLQCTPEPPTPTGVCSAYLNAAINTGFEMIFTLRTKTTRDMDVMDIEKKAKPEFKSDADQFIKKHGKSWFFCRCKADRLKGCTSMS